MILRVFGPITTNNDHTMNYVDYSCDSWEIMGNLLVLTRADEMLNIPLTSVRVFKEFRTESVPKYMQLQEQNDV